MYKKITKKFWTVAESEWWHVPREYITGKWSWSQEWVPAAAGNPCSLLLELGHSSSKLGLPAVHLVQDKTMSLFLISLTPTFWSFEVSSGGIDNVEIQVVEIARAFIPSGFSRSFQDKELLSNW